MTKALINSMRLRTLPLSLAGVVCGALLAWPHAEACMPVWTLVMLLLTTVSLQVLTNLSNELGDHLSGVDGEGREGPNYSMADGGLTVKQMWKAINAMVVVCCVSGLLMVWMSGSPWWLLLLGAAAIWAATHYTLRLPWPWRSLRLHLLRPRERDGGLFRDSPNVGMERADTCLRYRSAERGSAECQQYP